MLLARLVLCISTEASGSGPREVVETLIGKFSIQGL